MSVIQWNGYKWITQERWGNIHPDKTEVWYDESKVKIEDGILKLGVGYNPKEFEVEDGFGFVHQPMKKVISPYGVGLISCTEEFGYGIFEIEAKLPKGQPYAWPAFWMWAFDSWPPEIDVFESYSNKRGSYFNWDIRALLGKFWRCETNVHLGKSPDNYMLGAKKHFFGFKNPTKHFIKYSVIWNRDRLEFYYNGRCVRRIIDESMLSQMAGVKMNIIINNSFQNEIVGTGNREEYWLEVKNFRHIPLETTT